MYVYYHGLKYYDDFPRQNTQESIEEIWAMFRDVKCNQLVINCAGNIFKAWKTSISDAYPD